MEQDAPTAIVTDNPFVLLLGDVFHAVDQSTLDGAGVTHMLCVAQKCRLPPGCAADKKVLTVPLPENGQCDLTLPGATHAENMPAPSPALGRLDVCLEFVDSVKAEGGHLLLHCSTGNNRAAAVAIAWLIHSRGWTLQESMAHVQKARAGVNVSGEYSEQLKRFEAKKLGTTEKDTN